MTLFLSPIGTTFPSSVVRELPPRFSIQLHVNRLPADMRPPPKAKIKQFFISLILTLVGKPYTSIKKHYKTSLNGLTKEKVSEFLECVIQRDIPNHLWTRDRSSAFNVVADVFGMSFDNARRLFVHTNVQENGRGGKWHLDPDVFDELRGAAVADADLTPQQKDFRLTYRELCELVERLLSTPSPTPEVSEARMADSEPHIMDFDDLYFDEEDLKELSDLPQTELSLFDFGECNDKLPDINSVITEISLPGDDETLYVQFTLNDVHPVVGANCGSIGEFSTLLMTEELELASLLNLPRQCEG